MSEEKRMIETYEIEQSIYIGAKEILFGVDTSGKEEFPYLVTFCDYPLGYTHYFQAIVTDDYLEAMHEFLNRAETQVKSLQEERDKITVPLITLHKEDCCPFKPEDNIAGKLVVISPDCLCHEYRNIVHQLVLADSGNGCRGDTLGRAVFTESLYSGKEFRYERQDILGVIRPEKMPEWAKEKLQEIKQAERNQKKHSNLQR